MKIEKVFNCLGSNEENKFYNLQNQIYKMQFTIQDWYTIYGKGIKGLGQSSDLKSHESNYARKYTELNLFKNLKKCFESVLSW